MMSICYGTIELTKYLIDSGADLNIQDNEGNTALELSIKYKNTILAKILRNMM